MNEMRTMDYREDYRDDYRNYRDDYRDYRGDYRDNRDNRDYRDEYGRNQRDRYGRNRRSYRSYRDDISMMLEDAINDGMELSRTYEDIGEMTSNPTEKQKFMKIAEREKEHYRIAKEMLEKRM